MTLDMLDIDTTLLTFERELGKRADPRWHIWDGIDDYDQAGALCGKKGTGQYEAKVYDREIAAREDGLPTPLCPACVKATR